MKVRKAVVADVVCSFYSPCVSRKHSDVPGKICLWILIAEQSLVGFYFTTLLFSGPTAVALTVDRESHFWILMEVKSSLLIFGCYHKTKCTLDFSHWSLLILWDRRKGFCGKETNQALIDSCQLWKRERERVKSVVHTHVISATTLERQWGVYVNRLAEWLSFLLKVQRSTAKRHAGAAPLKSCLYERWGERTLWEKGRLQGTQNVSLNKAGKTCKPLACSHSRLCGHKPIKVFTWGVLTGTTLGPGVSLALFC